jgi:hypothetical protein
MKQNIHDMNDAEMVASLGARLKKTTDEEDARALCKLILKMTRRKKLVLDPNSALCREAPQRFKKTTQILDGVFLCRMDGKIFAQRALFVAHGVIHVNE